MGEFAGFPADQAKERIAITNSSSWYPGPAEFMAQRAGGVVCGYDGDDGHWDVMILPNAQTIIDGMALKRMTEEPSQCNEGSCTLMAREGDALLFGGVNAPSLTEDSVSAARLLAQTWVDRASASQDEAGFEVSASAIAGVGCDVLLPADDLNALWGVDAKMQDEFGGWGVPAEVFFVVDGGTFCVYDSDPGGYEGEQYLILTDLPGGAWAFDLLEGRTPTQVAGADAAYEGHHSGTRFVDILIGADWVRLTFAADAPYDLVAAAELVAANVASLQ